jgi:DNA-binding beta-propeller fold protein YncE
MQGLLRSYARASLAVLPIFLTACGSGPATGPAPAPAASSASTPGSGSGAMFQVDPAWPRELPNNWILGAITGVYVDSKDHVWVTHLPETLTPEETSAVQTPPIGTCCAPAPAVLEFNPQGELVQAWGEPSQDISLWPRNPHGIFVDHNDFVWVGTHMHHRVMKFTRDGKHVLTIGTLDQNKGSNDPALLGGPAGIWVDPKTNEVFVADGYRNRRVIVFEGETGKYLRHWGAYGEKPDDAYDFGDRDPNGPAPKQFSTVHGIIGSRDGMIYVADRRGNRIQVFDQSGKFLEEKIIAPLTLSSGSAFAFAFSPDQQLLHMADGTNHKVWTLRRDNLEVVGEFGRGGRQVGQFLRPHGMSADSKGNLYVGEASTGRRIQKFTFQNASR